MKKGFTLIELLAVIIILAVIALIATPLVLDVVDDARSQARKNSIFGYAEAVKLAAYEYQFKNYGANPTINEEWITSNVVTKGDTVTCEKVTFHETKGVLLSGCTVGTDDTLYYYDGNNALEEKPEGFDVLFPVLYKCKRAEEGTLHTETCTMTDTNNYCSAAGYTNGATIEYGTIKELGTNLESGDALNCDVNGDGTYDSVTERFYYVSSLYDTTTKSFNDEYAVLIYYTNFKNGEVNISGTSYDSSGEIWHGPVVAATHLPTVEQWTNISLRNTTRQILNDIDTNTVTVIDGTNRYNLPEFSYKSIDGTAYAARLLTHKELITACGEDGETVFGYLVAKCEYLLENTLYSDFSMKTYGIWLETPSSVNTLGVQSATASDRRVIGRSANYSYYGVRPVIEVKYTDILH